MNKIISFFISMTKLQKCLWIGVLLTCLMIFTLSAQDATESSDLSGSFTETLLSFIIPNYDEKTEAQQMELVDNFETLVRKMGHFSEYCFLGILLFSNLETYSENRKKTIPATLIACCLYATSDEIHQIFVVGRSCQFFDVCIDTSGSAFGIFVVVFFKLIYQKLQNRKTAL